MTEDEIHHIVKAQGGEFIRCSGGKHVYDIATMEIAEKLLALLPNNAAPYNWNPHDPSGLPKNFRNPHITVTF
jgi:hypothetical protein